MDRLPEPLLSFRQYVEADLRRGARLIIHVQDMLDPQVRIATPEGDYLVAVTLPPETAERDRMLWRLSNFMSWKQAVSFTFVSELLEPDCIYAVGVSHREVTGCLSVITRQQRPWSKSNFGPVQWLERSQIGEELPALLPRGARELTKRDIAELEDWFGRDGKFPALHIASGQLRGLE